MKTRDELLKYANNPDDRLILSKLTDKAEFAEKTNRLAHSEFLDPHQINLAVRVLALLDKCEYEMFGGFSGAERAVALFFPEYVTDDEITDFRSAVLKVLEIMPNARGSLTHRDYLGALMALGIKREVIGDIIVKDDKCSIVVLEDIAEYIALNLIKVGNTGVSVEILDIMDLYVPEPKASEVKTTVAALRLDSICAPAFGLSRSKAAELIKAGRVNLNWEISQNPDKPVREGDTISIRGKGRAVLDKVGGRTRKDRLAVSIKKLI